MDRSTIALAKKMDWECIESETTYLSHAIHRYSGKFIPQIAYNAIELLTKPGETVLDVYAGSGTTLLEAARLGRKSIGIDISPLAVLITSVKTTPIAKSELSLWHHQFRDSVLDFPNTSQQNFLFAPKGSIISIDKDTRLTSDWYNKWFQKNILRELIWIDAHVHRIENESLRNVAKVALSDILRKCSNAHSSYPNVMYDKNKKKQAPAIPRFLKRLDEIVLAVSTIGTSIVDDNVPKILTCSNTDLPLTSESVDAIVTHPPYIGSVPYAEYGVLSLTWFGSSAKELDKVLTGGGRQKKNVVDRFISDYKDMMSEAYKVLKPGKSLFMLVGNPTVRGEIIRLDKISVQLAKECGFKKSLELTRKGANRRANKMGLEHILFFTKG